MADTPLEVLTYREGLGDRLSITIGALVLLGVSAFFMRIGLQGYAWCFVLALIVAIVALWVAKGVFAKAYVEQLELRADGFRLTRTGSPDHFCAWSDVERFDTEASNAQGLYTQTGWVLKESARKTPLHFGRLCDGLFPLHCFGRSGDTFLKTLEERRKQHSGR